MAVSALHALIYNSGPFGRKTFYPAKAQILTFSAFLQQLILIPSADRHHL